MVGLQFKRSLRMALVAAVLASGPVACQFRGRRPSAKTPISIEPDSPVLDAGGRLELKALRKGVQDWNVAWSLNPGEGAIILSKGVFLAGPNPGLYIVEARDPRPGGAVARIEVQVGARSEASNSATRAELLDPASQTVLSLPPMAVSHCGHGAALLADGRVLILGGTSDDGRTPVLAEFYNPATRSFRPYLDPVPAPAAQPLALVALAGGQVLVVSPGSMGGGTALSLFNPKTGGFRALAPLPQRLDTALGLRNGMALLLGDGLAVILDPRSGFAQNLVSPLLAGLSGYTLTELSNGRVLLAGGLQNLPGQALVEAGEALGLDLAGLTVTREGALLTPRWNHLALLRPTGEVVLMGGHVRPGSQTSNGPDIRGTEVPMSYGSADATTRAESYDPVSHDWHKLAPLEFPLPNAPSLLLRDGRFLLVGGRTPQEASNGTWFFDPVFNRVKAGPLLPRKIGGHTLTQLADGKVLIAGGRDESRLVR